MVQDNAPADKSAYTTADLPKCGTKIMDCPPEFPDSNPIKHIWGNLKGYVREQNVGTTDGLREAVLTYWRTLTPKVCGRYINGIRKRLHRDVEQGGRNIFECR